jgi:hypothetical protein
LAIEAPVLYDPYRSILESFMHSHCMSPYGADRTWLLMHKALVSTYSSMLAEDFAAANKLQPTTDQNDAFCVANDWSSDQLAAFLLAGAKDIGRVSSTGMAEVLGFLALDLVIPANIDSVPLEKLIEIRRRYGSEFFAFGSEIHKVAAELANLPRFRDQSILNSYAKDLIGTRFANPLKELSKQMRGLKLDVTTMAVNVRTELPAGTGVAAGAMLLGHPAIAGGTAATIGLLVMRRGIRQRRASILSLDPAVSFLLHTSQTLNSRGLLDRILNRFQQVAGVDAG